MANCAKGSQKPFVFKGKLAAANHTEITSRFFG